MRENWDKVGSSFPAASSLQASRPMGPGCSPAREWALLALETSCRKLYFLFQASSPPSSGTEELMCGIAVLKSLCQHINNDAQALPVLLCPHSSLSPPSSHRGHQQVAAKPLAYIPPSQVILCVVMLSSHPPLMTFGVNDQSCCLPPPPAQRFPLPPVHHLWLLHLAQA